MCEAMKALVVGIIIKLVATLMLGIMTDGLKDNRLSFIVTIFMIIT